jgi:predicted RNase H-like HicB family nuclease
MKTVRAILSKGPDDFGVWLEDLKGVYGAGDTPAEALKSLRESMALYLKHNADAPAWLKNGSYRISYKFDAESILNYYKGIFTNAALERITGINQKQIQHYASGLKKPRPEQLRKIEMAFKKLGSELTSVELV